MSKYTVMWTDRDYKDHRKVFQDDPKGAAENGLKKARAFKAKIEKSSDTSEYGTIRGKVDLKVEEDMSDMRKILEAAEANATGTLDETVGASLVDRMASAMLSAPKLEVLATRVFEDDAQRQMFDGMITEPLRALIAKALDAAGATVSGGVLAKAGREMKGVARGGMSAPE